jgi:hypothetical protein
MAKREGSSRGADLKDVVDELDGIKRLLVLLLVKLGSDSGEIGLALDVDSSAIRRMFPTRQVKKLVEN